MGMVFYALVGMGAMGKSRVVEVLVELFANKAIWNRLMVTVTSETAAARIDSITIHSACHFPQVASRMSCSRDKDVEGFGASNLSDHYVNGERTGRRSIC